MIPRRASGTKTADRAPITMRISPLRAPRQSDARCAPESRLCSTATDSPNLRLKRDVACGMRAISGTRTRALFPMRSASSMQRRYTSVFPLPVTPWSRKRAEAPESSAARIDSNAAA